MADFGAPVINPQGTNPGANALNTLSGILGIKEQQAKLQQEQQTTRQRAGIANWMQQFDPSQHAGPDGTLDLDSVLTDPKLRQAAGDQFPDLVSKMIGIKQTQLQAKQQLVNLNDALRSQFQSTVSGLRTDPDVIADSPVGREKVQKAVGQFAASGPDAARISQIYGSVFNNVPQGKLAQTLSNVQLQAMDAATQAGRQAPALVNTGAAQVNVNPQAAGGNLGPQQPIKNQVPPGFATFEAGGNLWAVNPQDPNHAMLVGQGGQPSAPAKPPINVPGQKDISDSIDAARAADSQVGMNRDINRRILTINKETSTGPGTGFLHQALAAVGLPAGASYQELGAFLERQAATASQGMGLPATNAGLSAAQQFTGNTQQDNRVIADKTKFVDALQAGTAAYRAGMERVLGDPNNPNFGGYQKFRAAWAQNFDPEVFAYENAVRNGDKEDQQRIEKDLGRKGMTALYQKRQKLMNLVNGQ